MPHARVRELRARRSHDTQRRRSDQRITHGLLILKEPLDKILAGTKTWEIRGKSTARRGPIALIESKSGRVMGTCEVVDVVGPLTRAELQRNPKRTGFPPGQLPYPTTYAWVVRHARRVRRLRIRPSLGSWKATRRDER